MVTKIAPSGNVPITLSLFKKWLVSFTKEGIYDTNGFSWLSANAEIFSVGVLQSDMTGRPGQFNLCIFGKR